MSLEVKGLRNYQSTVLKVKIIMSDFDFSSPPVQFSELECEQGKKWNEQCCNLFYDEGYVKLGNIKGVYARNYVRFFERIRDFQVFPDDVWVVSFPKCGMFHITLV